MTKNRKVRALLKSTMMWPLYLVAVLVIMTVYLYFIDVTAGKVATVFVLIYGIGLAVAFVLKSRSLSPMLAKFGQNYGQVMKTQIKNLAIPYAVIDAEGRLLSANNEFVDLFDGPVRANTSMFELMPDVKKELMPNGTEITDDHIEISGMNFRIEFQNLQVEPENWDAEAPEERQEHVITAVYLYDETENVKLKRLINDRQLAVGLAYIDNYEEVFEKLDEVKRSLLVALIDKKISKYFQNANALIKKLEKDKYLVVMQKQYLQELENQKFTILDDVRDINMSNEVSVTLSIGMGSGYDSYIESYEAARAAMDLALGRGGDQTVIKDIERFYYFGGKSNSVERSTRVKARVKAQSLREIIESKDQLIIMGHKMSDADSFGAAVGFYSIAHYYGKKAHIVLDEVNSSVKSLVDRFRTNQDYEDMIFNHDQALAAVDENTVLVIVDVNRPSITECEELLDAVSTKVLIDHHRQTSDSITDAALSYVEPYASSACEMVAEILQYIATGNANSHILKSLEADAMYAGIMIDTNSFMTKSGVRTYEAAAYLKRNGADVMRIRKLFRADMNEYMIKAKAAANTKRFMNEFAITECDAAGSENPTVLGAQVANELMDIDGIKASFVLTEYNGQIFVSARSMDEINVQIIMEKLGGGGHMNVAGTQFSECSMEEARQMVCDAIKTMREGGEI